MKNQTKKSTLIFFIIFPIIMLVPLYISGKMEIKYLFGELAYCLFIFDTILGLRPEWIEKKIEFKKIYMMHGIIAIFAVCFAILHDLVSHLHGIAGLFGDVAFYGSIAITVLALIFLSSQILSIIPGANKIVDIIRKIAAKFKIDRELNLLFHTLAPLIVVFIFLHVCFVSEFIQNSDFMFFFAGYFIIFAVLYIYYGIYKKIVVSKYKMKSLDMLNDNTYKLVLEYNKGKKVTVKSGQFVFIHAPFSKLDEYHPFSVVESIGDGETITLGIKDSGDFTKRLENIEPGTTIKIKGAYGHFVAPNNDDPILLIAGGIGVTACLGLLENLPADKKAYLVWSIHSDKDFVFKDEIKQLSATHPNLKIIIHDSLKEGHLNAKSLVENVPELQNNERIDCFVCGPKPMMDSMEKALIRQNVPKKYILTEGFVF